MDKVKADKSRNRGRVDQEQTSPAGSDARFFMDLASSEAEQAI
jgi:hypothetical protein